MPSLIAALSKEERQELTDDLNYLNTSEIKSFCQRHGIPFEITIEARNGSKKKTGEDDRKGVILDRIRHFLRTGIVQKETCFSAKVTDFGTLSDELGPEDRLFYGQYDKANQRMISLLKALTDGKFRNGAIARIAARDFWSRGEAPTFCRFAAAWMLATKRHNSPNPEWAFLSDRALGKAGSDWKKLRQKKAKKVLRTLDQLTRSIGKREGRT
jgi:hypothetical protein